MHGYDTSSEHRAQNVHGWERTLSIAGGFFLLAYGLRKGGLAGLVELGWEVCVMKSPSIRYCPGGFWRFLALEEEDAIVTVIDSDRIGQAAGDIERTELMDRLDLALWRVPGYYNADTAKEVRYRPILGGHFGARGGLIKRGGKDTELGQDCSRRAGQRIIAELQGSGDVEIRVVGVPQGRQALLAVFEGAQIAPHGAGRIVRQQAGTHAQG